MPKVRFYLDNGANIHSKRVSKWFDTEEDFWLDDEEWEAMSEEEKYQMAEEYIHNNGWLEIGYEEEKSDG